MTTIDNKRARISNKILITINNKKYHWASDRDAYNGINDLGYLKTARTPKKEYLINVILPWFKKNGSLEKRREHQKCKNYFINGLKKDSTFRLYMGGKTPDFNYVKSNVIHRGLLLEIENEIKIYINRKNKIK